MHTDREQYIIVKHSLAIIKGDNVPDIPGSFS